MTAHAILKPITVQGVVIDVETLTRIVNRVRAYPGTGFRYVDVITACVSSDVPIQVRERAADRLLQILRKQELIEYKKGFWEWRS